MKNLAVEKPFSSPIETMRQAEPKEVMVAKPY
jgi:hypothetical protein